MEIKRKVGFKELYQADRSDLRNIRIAVGIDIVFKYRIGFIINLGEFIQDDKRKSYLAIASQEATMNREMVTWENDRQHVLRMH